MPITQDRLLALISIVDEVIDQREISRQIISNYVVEATEEFQKTENKADATLSSRLFALIQAIDSTMCEPMLSYDSISTLAREREHFRLRKGHNARARRYMSARRNSTSNEPSNHEQ